MIQTRCAAAGIGMIGPRPVGLPVADVMSAERCRYAELSPSSPKNFACQVQARLRGASFGVRRGAAQLHPTEIRKVREELGK